MGCEFVKFLCKVFFGAYLVYIRKGLISSQISFQAYATVNDINMLQSFGP